MATIRWAALALGPAAGLGVASCYDEAHEPTAVAITALHPTWPRHAEWDRQSLVLDWDGALLLASSDAKTHKHAIARIDTRRDPLSMDGLVQDHGEFVMPPVVDVDGYTLLFWQDQGNGKVDFERMDSLPFGPPGSLTDIGKQL
jgi:hypothetical protein